MSDVRPDDDTPTHPASDAQRTSLSHPIPHPSSCQRRLAYSASTSFLLLAPRYSGSGSRKRTPLPSQGAAYRPGTRPAPVQRSAAVYPPGPVGLALVAAPENRHTSRSILDEPSRDLRRRSPSPQPQLDYPAERGDRDRGRWSNLHANGPSRPTHEFSRGRVHEVAMDIDKSPLPRSSDAPTRQVPPR